MPPAPPAPPGGTPQPPYSAGPVRSAQRRSIFPGLLLIVVGSLLLAAQLHPDIRLGYIVSHFWPVIIILWGVSRLIERYTHSDGSARASILSGGEVALIFVLAALTGLVAFGNWVSPRLPHARGFAPFNVLTEQYSGTKRINVKQVTGANSLFTITTPQGAINIHPSDDNGLAVTGNATASANTLDQARERINDLDLAFDGPTGNYQIHPVNANGGGISVDIDAALPKAASVVARSQRGDVSVNGVQGTVDASTRNGTINIHDTGSTVTADMQNSGAQIHSVAGDVNLSGRGGGNVEIADVKGAVTLSGNLFGNVDVRNAPKGVHYSSSRSNVQIGSLAGELKMDTGDINLSQASGQITVNARNQDVTIDEANGQMDISDNRGNIEVTFSKPPKSVIAIHDDAGNVTLTLPAGSAFMLTADSKSGEITGDFGTTSANSNDDGSHHLETALGSNGPTIRISTKYGNISIKKLD